MKFGSLFSGIGAPEFALKSLSIPHSVEFACDNDQYVKKTYMLHHKCKKFYDDVQSIKKIPNIDLLVFGFPCQPFSLAGRREGMDDLRGKLVLKAIKLMQQNPPQMFIAENVEGLTKIDNGKSLNLLIKQFSNIGYKVQYRVLNSRDFGVPHNRKRLWIVGSMYQNFDFDALPCYNESVLSDWLDHQVDEGVFATSSFLQKPKVKKRLENYTNSYINCITQTICRNGSSGEYISYVAAVHHAIGQARKPTVKEVCRLFGLPNDFCFPESVFPTRQYAMLANSMDIKVLKCLIESLLCVRT